MFQKLSESSGNIIGYKVEGKLTDADYQMLIPKLDALIEQEGKIRFLVMLDEFQGAELKAMWDDLKFGTKHGRDIERLAVVGDKKWEQWLTSLSSPLYAKQAKYFHNTDLEAAWAWLREAN